jgi:KaiC/GvpD/RAD55 family RecA-like ATPase
VSEVLKKLFAEQREDTNGGEFGNCRVCRRRPALDAKGLCVACDHVARQEPGVLAANQTALAMKLLRSAKNTIRWPWHTVDEIFGPLRLSTVNYVVAASGVGKTTFTLDLVRRWLAKGVGVTVLPLETDAADWRLALSAVEVGLQHGALHEMAAAQSAGDPQYDRELSLVANQLMTSGADPVRVKHLYVVPDRRVDTESVDKAFAVAAAMGHQVVIIDHIDHVESSGSGVSDNAAVVRDVNNAVLDLAKYHQLCVIAMSQANASIMGDGSNPLLRFQRPQIKHVAYNSLKVPNANQILGLFRDVDPATSRRDFAMAREGAIEPQQVLLPNCTSIAALKLRDRGQNEGRKVNLWYRNGQLLDWTDHDRQRDAAQRMLSEGPFGHTTIVYRQRRAKDGSEQKDRGSDKGTQL